MKGNRHTALIIIPGVNYFHDQMGRRLAEALRNLGVQTDIHTLGSYTPREYDRCFVINPYEAVFGFGDEAGGLRRLQTIKRRCGQIATVLLECIRTGWFEHSYRVSRMVGVSLFLDGGIVEQSRLIPARVKIDYRFFFNGLLESERERARGILATAGERPIPWVVVGHLTPERVRLAQRLAQTVDPSGFVYLPRLTPVTESGPHLNEQQFHRVLERAKYQVWCSHHRHFYMEGERFRASLLAGGIPIKVVLYPWDRSLQIPFDYLLMEEKTFDEQLYTMDFLSMRRRFAEDFLSLPTLEESLGSLLQIPNMPATPHAAIMRRPDEPPATADRQSGS
jgi:hypothetical protein